GRGRRRRVGGGAARRRRRLVAPRADRPGARRRRLDGPRLGGGSRDGLRRRCAPRRAARGPRPALGRAAGARMILAVDTSIGTAVALVDDDARTVVERSSADTRGHAEAIGTLLAEAFAEAGVGPDAVTAVAVGLGPGPFTGLRVGI